MNLNINYPDWLDTKLYCVYRNDLIIEIVNRLGIKKWLQILNLPAAKNLLLKKSQFEDAIKLHNLEYSLNKELIPICKEVELVITQKYSMIALQNGSV